MDEKSENNCVREGGVRGRGGKVDEAWEPYRFQRTAVDIESLLIFK